MYLRLIGLSLLTVAVDLMCPAIPFLNRASHRFLVGAVVYFAAVRLVQRTNTFSSKGQLVAIGIIAAPALFFKLPFFLFEADTLFRPLAFSPLLGIAGAVVIKKIKRQWIGTIAFLLLTLLLSYIGYPNYFAAFTGRQASRTVDQRLALPLIDASGRTMNLRNTQQAVVVLDLWFTGCVACFQKFPDLQKLSDRYRDDSEVLIAAVNIPLPEERDSTKLPFDLLSKYKFKKLRATSNTDENAWHVLDGYPEFLVFDKQRRLRYSGQLIIAPYIQINNAYRIIDALKKEAN